ncbi:ArsB/NhaD family transporter [Lentisphaerota bacterium WC36G]|nr:ArsB/NhaD family transporter [Lentisphaerae bacterium WC36]
MITTFFANAHTAIAETVAHADKTGTFTTPMIVSMVIFLITYFFIATEKIDKTIAAILGASAIVLAHAADLKKVIHHIDLEVIGLLIGMMLIVNSLATTGVFEWLAIKIAKKAKGNALLILIELLIITAVLSALLDNVTTVILIAPITILITQILELPTVPFLILEAVFSNIGGTSTLVGDPPNILIGTHQSALAVAAEHKTLSFMDFIVNLGPVVVVIMIISIIIVMFFMKKRLKVSPEAVERIERTRPELAIINPKGLLICSIIFIFVMVGFLFGRTWHLEPSLFAIVGGILMVFFCKHNLHHSLEKVEWGTIMFFVGLFMLIGALQENGIFKILGEAIVDLTKGNLLLTAIVILWSSAILSAIVDNIPLVMAMIPVISTIVPEFGDALGVQDPEVLKTAVENPLLWSLALGACLGGNGSLVGASANVVIAQIAKKNKYKLSFGNFTAVGLPLMIVSLIISTGYIYIIIHFAQNSIK